MLNEKVKQIKDGVVIAVFKEMTQEKSGLVQPIRQKRSDTGFLQNNKCSSRLDTM